MTIKEVIEQLGTIKHERTLQAHHDDMFFQTYDDVEALERVINVINFLAKKKPSDKLTVAEIFKETDIEF